MLNIYIAMLNVIIALRGYCFSFFLPRMYMLQVWDMQMETN